MAGLWPPSTCLAWGGLSVVGFAEMNWLGLATEECKSVLRVRAGAAGQEVYFTPCPLRCRMHKSTLENAYSGCLSCDCRQLEAATRGFLFAFWWCHDSCLVLNVEPASERACPLRLAQCEDAEGKLGQRDLWIGSPCSGTAGDSALATPLKPRGEGGGLFFLPLLQ